MFILLLRLRCCYVYNVATFTMLLRLHCCYASYSPVLPFYCFLSTYRRIDSRHALNKCWSDIVMKKWACGRVKYGILTVRRHNSQERDNLRLTRRLYFFMFGRGVSIYYIIVAFSAHNSFIRVGAPGATRHSWLCVRGDLGYF